MRGFRCLLVITAALALPGCIADLPESEYPCLVATEAYDRFNEAWVFSPRGDSKREALERAQEAERRCAAAQ